MLGVEPRALCMLGKCSNAELYPSPLFVGEVLVREIETKACAFENIQERSIFMLFQL